MACGVDRQQQSGSSKFAILYFSDTFKKRS
jgi:hypothetical protein